MFKFPKNECGYTLEENDWNKNWPHNNCGCLVPEKKKILNSASLEVKLY